jgi:hypothetical protein
MAISLDRGLSEEERAIAEWLLTNATPPALSYIPQLDRARVTGRCKCGCPTATLSVPDGVARGEPRDNPVGDAFGTVDGNLVGVMLFLSDGLLSSLEVYDLSEIEHPYGLPDLSTLRPAAWNQG